MHQRALILFTGLCCLLAGSASIQAETADSQVSQIRARYHEINRNAKTFRKIKKEAAGFSAEGGELTAYLHGNAVLKIDATFFGESGRAQNEFYFENNKLIFCFAKTFRYDKPLSGKVVSTREERLYFQNGNLIRWLDGRKSQALAGEEAASARASTLETAASLLKLVKE